MHITIICIMMPELVLERRKGECVGNRFPLSITKDHYLSFLVYSADNQGLYNWGTYRCGGGVGETGTRSTYAR